MVCRRGWQEENTHSTNATEINLIRTTFLQMYQYARLIEVLKAWHYRVQSTVHALSERYLWASCTMIRIFNVSFGDKRVTLAHLMP